MSERVAEQSGETQATPEPSLAESGGAQVMAPMSRASTVLGLQRAAGNAAVARYLSGAVPSAARAVPTAPGARRPDTSAGARALATAAAARRPSGHVLTPPYIARAPTATVEAEADPDAKVSLGPLDEDIITLFAGSAMGEGRWTVLREFLRGMWGGVQSAPAEQLARIEAKFDNFGVLDALKYGAGFNLGIPEGLWLSIKSLAEAVWTLVKLPYNVNQFLLEKVPELAAKYGPRLVAFATEGDGLRSRLAKAINDALEHPRQTLQQLSGFLDALKALGLTEVRALGRGAAGKLLDFIALPWFTYGRELGKIAGQIIFEVVLALASDLIANAVKEAVAVAARLATKALTGMVELLRSAGRMLGQTVEWLQGLGRRVTGEIGELFEAAKDLLSRVRALLDDLAAEGALADTGAGGTGMPVPRGPSPANVLESRATRPPGSPTVADLTPPKVHPSKTPSSSAVPTEDLTRARGLRRHPEIVDEELVEIGPKGPKTKPLPPQGTDPYQNYVAVRDAAERSSKMGADRVPTMAKTMGPATEHLAGRQLGWQSRDGMSGWRVDYDPKTAKGMHVNWWRIEEGVRYQGSIRVRYGDERVFLDVLRRHFAPGSGSL